MNNKTGSVWELGASQASVKSKPKLVLKLGLDMHYRQVYVGMQQEDGPIKVVGTMGHQTFSNWVEKRLQEGWEIYSCYEAGASGYWLHRELEQLGG